MSNSITSLFDFELRQGSHQFAPPTKGRDRGLDAFASWLRKALDTVLPIDRNRAGERDEPATAVASGNIAGAKASVRRIESAPRCRMCGTRGARRVCATCATAGFIELRCGCVERPDGSRYACDAAIDRWLDGALVGDAAYGPAVRAAFATWADAATVSTESCALSSATEDGERLWSQR